MKKLLLTLLFISILLFSSCSIKDAEPTTIAPETTMETTAVTESTTEGTAEATESPLQTYPLNVGKAYSDFAIVPPDHIYNTLGSENGLAGTIYTFDGIVTAIEDMKADGFTYPLAVVETDRGPVMILDMYTAVYNASLKRIGNANTKSLYDDSLAFYHFPEIGETANFIAVYMGYSSAKELPSFIYGASPDIFTIGQYDDPVAIAFEEE